MVVRQDHPHHPPHTTTPDSGTSVFDFGHRVLTAQEITAHNSFDNPEYVKPTAFSQFTVTDNGFTATLPPKSVVVLEIE